MDRMRTYRSRLLQTYISGINFIGIILIREWRLDICQKGVGPEAAKKALIDGHSWMLMVRSRGRTFIQNVMSNC